MNKILFISDKPINYAEGVIAGLQIRIHEMSLALCRLGYKVFVAERKDDTHSYEKNGITYFNVNKLSEYAQFDICILHPFMYDEYKGNVKNLLLIVDGYEHPYGSFLSFSSHQYGKYGNKALKSYKKWINIYYNSISKADLILCANEYQRISYLTILCYMGIINPINYNDNRLLVLQSGTLDNLTNDIPDDFKKKYSINSSSKKILWNGGIYPWFDFETFIKAMPLIIDSYKDVQFVFVGLKGIQENDYEKNVDNRILKLISEIKGSRLNDYSVFIPWLPYTERKYIYRLSDIGVCLSKDRIESIFSMRTRVIDMIGAGIPLVVTGGDELSTVLQIENAAIIVNFKDHKSVAENICKLLVDKNLRNELSGNLLSLHKNRLNWDLSVKELDVFIRGRIKEL